jgi:hypothetical protein
MLAFSSVFDNDSFHPGLVFVHDRIDGCAVLNVGEVLAEELAQCDLKSATLPMVAYDVLKDILDDNIHVGESGEKYLVIENLSILFEQQLALDVESLFRSYSRSVLLVVVTEYPIVNGCFRPFGDSSDIKVDLDGICYSEKF